MNERLESQRKTEEKWENVARTLVFFAAVISSTKQQPFGIQMRFGKFFEGL